MNFSRIWYRVLDYTKSVKIVDFEVLKYENEILEFFVITENSTISILEFNLITKNLNQKIKQKYNFKVGLYFYLLKSLKISIQPVRTGSYKFGKRDFIFIATDNMDSSGPLKVLEYDGLKIEPLSDIFWKDGENGNGGDKFCWSR